MRGCEVVLTLRVRQSKACPCLFSVGTSFFDRIKKRTFFDNAPLYKTSAVNDYLAQRSITVMPHPAYSPDIAPSDFWFFGFLKQQLENYSDEK